VSLRCDYCISKSPAIIHVFSHLFPIAGITRKPQSVFESFTLHSEITSPWSSSQAGQRDDEKMIIPLTVNQTSTRRSAACSEGSIRGAYMQTGNKFHKFARYISIKTVQRFMNSIGGLVVKLAVAIRVSNPRNNIGQPRVRFPADAFLTIIHSFAGTAVDMHPTQTPVFVNQ
jgi:hypothetical protein